MTQSFSGSAVLKSDSHNLTVHIRPTAENVLVERSPSERIHNGIIMPFSDNWNIQVSKVLAIGPRVTGLRVGDSVVHIKVIGRRVDDKELETKAGKRVWLMKSDDCLAVLDVETGSLKPTADRLLVRLPPDQRELGSGIVIVEEESLLIKVSQVLGIGPKVKEVKSGDNVIHHKIEPVRIDDPELTSKFGERLGIIKEETCQATVQYFDGDTPVTGHGYGKRNR